MQTNYYGVAYSVSALGKAFHDALNAEIMSDCLIAAAKKNETILNQDPGLLDRRIRENEPRFIAIRSSFGSSLASYAGDAPRRAGDILHFCFSTVRGSTDIPAAYQNKVDHIHALLGLKTGEALLNKDHPVMQEYDPDDGGGIRRVFPVKGTLGVQVFTKHVKKDSCTRDFIVALGVFHSLLNVIYLNDLDSVICDVRPNQQVEAGRGGR